MLYLILGLFARIFSNSFLNVFQKFLTNNGQKSSVVNFYTYAGLALLGLPFYYQIHINTSILSDVIIMGILGALGNYFIIKALSVGELSVLAPINSYKPVVPLIIGIFYLHEIPSIQAVLAILLIIAGTYFIINTNGKINKTALLYRIFALIFSGSEAIFIKKIILNCGITSALLLWILSGLLFSFLFVIFSKHKLQKPNFKYQIPLIISVCIMQYSTNYVFSKMNVSYALALFQLSTLLSIFLGANLFKEKDFLRKLAGSVIMIIGAIILILH